MRWQFATLLLLLMLLAPLRVRAVQSLAALNIRPGDLPTGLLTAFDATLTPAQWDATQHDVRGTAAKSGMTGISFEVFYLGAVSRHAVGGIVAHYADESAARAAYVRIIAPIVKEHAAKARPFAAPNLGDGRYGFIDPESSIAATGLYFWRGGYVVSVGIQGYTELLSPALAVRLAGTVDSRIRRAG